MGRYRPPVGSVRGGGFFKRAEKMEIKTYERLAGWLVEETWVNRNPSSSHQFLLLIPFGGGWQERGGG